MQLEKTHETDLEKVQHKEFRYLQHNLLDVDDLSKREIEDILQNALAMKEEWFSDEPLNP